MYAKDYKLTCQKMYSRKNNISGLSVNVHDYSKQCRAQHTIGSMEKPKFCPRVLPGGGDMTWLGLVVVVVVTWEQRGLGVGAAGDTVAAVGDLCPLTMSSWFPVLTLRVGTV